MFSLPPHSPVLKMVTFTSTSVSSFDVGLTHSGNFLISDTFVIILALVTASEIPSATSTRRFSLAASSADEPAPVIAMNVSIGANLSKVGNPRFQVVYILLYLSERVNRGGRQN